MGFIVIPAKKGLDLRKCDTGPVTIPSGLGGKLQKVCKVDITGGDTVSGWLSETH